MFFAGFRGYRREEKVPKHRHEQGVLKYKLIYSIDAKRREERKKTRVDGFMSSLRFGKVPSDVGPLRPHRRDAAASAPRGGVNSNLPKEPRDPHGVWEMARKLVRTTCLSTPVHEQVLVPW